LLRSRLLVGGIVWLAALALFAAALQSPVRARRLHRPPTSDLARTLDAAAGPGSSRHPWWGVVNAKSALHLLVADVEADDATDARAIAARIVAPIRGRYDEILIYVRQTGAADALAARRVQWTPRGGFAELIIH
jgi:hypothetical protein